MGRLSWCHSTGTYLIIIPKTKKIILTWDMTFLQKSYSEYSKVEKPVLVTLSFEGSDEEDELKTFPIISQTNKNNHLVSNSNSDSDGKNQENIFNEDIGKEVKVTPNTTFNAKVVHAMKKLKASYNNNANKIIKQATQEKCAIENLNFLIDPTMGIDPKKNLIETGNMLFVRNLLTSMYNRYGKRC